MLIRCLYFSSERTQRLRRAFAFSQRFLAVCVSLPITLYQLQPFIDLNGVIVYDWLRLCRGKWRDFCDPIPTFPSALRAYSLLLCLFWDLEHLRRFGYDFPVEIGNDFFAFTAS